MRKTLIFIIIHLVISAGYVMAANSGDITQGEFVARLVSALKWEGGRTELKEADYKAILSGKRVFKFEAEEIYDARRDNVSVRSYDLYGPFSGGGWVSGVSVPALVHLKTFIPVEGEYTLFVASKGDGQVWRVGEKIFTVNSGGALRQVEAGRAFLKAGTHEIVVQLPPEGAVDYLILKAPPLQPIEPLAGWRFDAPLRMHELAEVEAGLLGLEASFPIDDTVTGKKIVEVSALKELPSTVTSTSISYLGAFLGKKWLRAGISGADLEIPIEIPESGFYSIRLRLLGKEAVVNFSESTFTIAGQPYLEWSEYWDFRLHKGIHKLHVTISPGGGLDVVEIIKRTSAPSTYMSAVGLKGAPNKVVSNSEVDGIINALLTRFNGRR